LAPIAEVAEIALDLEVPAYPVVFDYGVRIYCLLSELIDIVLYEGCIQSESTNQFVLKTPFVHQSEVDVTAKKRIFIYVNNYLLKMLAFTIPRYP
jgi:hypothetical protein